MTFVIIVIVTGEQEVENCITKRSDIWEIIFNRHVRTRHLFAVMIGLPNSGTTALLLRFLDRSKAKDDSKGLNIYETILFKDSVTGQYTLKDITDDSSKSDLMILLSLSKFLVAKHYDVKLTDHQLSEVMFDHPEVNTYFGELCTKLSQMMKDFNMPATEPDPHKLKVMLTSCRSYSFINFFDINVNKAVYEAVFILGSNYSSIVLFNVLDLYYYTKEKLAKPLDLSDSDYNEKYGENERYLFSLHKALHAYVLPIETAFASKRESHNTILVGTHADELDSISDAEVRAGEVYKLIDTYAKSIKIDGALSTEFPKIIPITNVKDSTDYKTVMEFFF